MPNATHANILAISQHAVLHGAQSSVPLPDDVYPLKLIGRISMTATLQEASPARGY